jgi:signal transduction histidine kinase
VLRAFSEQQASFTADAARGDSPDAQYFRSAGIRAVLATPIIASGRRLGVLRNPLTAILGTVQVLGRRLKRSAVVETEWLAAAATTIESSALQMNGLIDGLLDAACLQMDRAVEIRPRPIDLVALTSRVVMALGSANDCHLIKLSSTADRIAGVWDAGRLERVLQNLLGNAVKYSPGGGEIDVQLWRELRDGQEWAVLSVSDDGLGIPTSDQARIFERFKRGANVSASIAGTGIGLAVSQQVIEQHGGSIGVESREGQGSTFIVRLPVVVETSECAESAEYNARGGTSRPYAMIGGPVLRLDPV